MDGEEYGDYDYQNPPKEKPLRHGWGGDPKAQRRAEHDGEEAEWENKNFRKYEVPQRKFGEGEDGGFTEDDFKQK